MNIIVLIKGVIDPEKTVECNESGTILNKLDDYIINPNDSHAIEEGLQIVDKIGGKVTVMSLGNEEVTSKVLRAGLSLGAEDAFRIKADWLPKNISGENLLGTVLANAIKTVGSFDLVITGANSVDNNMGLVGVQVSDELGIPYIDNVVDLELKNGIKFTSDYGEMTVRGLEELPAVISVIKDINKVRLPNFKGKMLANKATINEVIVSQEDIYPEGIVDTDRQVKEDKVLKNKIKSKTKMIFDSRTDSNAVQKLVSKLKEENLI